MSGFLRKYGWRYLPGFLFLGLTAYLQTLIPHFLGQIIDTLNAPAGPIDRPVLFRLLMLLILVSLAVFATRFTWRSLIMGNSRYLEIWLRQRLFDHLLTLPVAFYQQQKTGNLMSYAINDIGAIRQTLGPGLAMAVNALAMSTLAISSMSGRISPRLTWLALLPVPPILVLVLLLGRHVQRRFRKVQEAFSAISDRIQESISGILVIKAHSQEDEESERFETLNQESRARQLRMVRVSAAASPLVAIFFGISFSIGLIYGSQLVISGQISLGDFVAFNGYLALIVQPVQSVARIINMLQRGAASWKRYQAIMSEIPAVCDRPDSLAEDSLPQRSEGVLTIQDLTFYFEGHSKPALEKLSLELHPGKRVGILGRTGSGKSTLANLLVRLHEAPTGSIRLDGRPIDRLPLSWLRRQIALVPQDNFLFSASLDENIRFFDPKPAPESVRQAAVQADLDETVRSFPNGYQTVIGERGVTLSGGQKQRVGLARALLKQSPVLVLDDALSAVDTETEQRILDSLATVSRGQACLIIANRISALQECDEILVLEDGRVSDRGTHAELLSRGGFYAAIAARQSSPGGVL